MTTLSLPPVGAARRRGPSAWSLGAALIALIVVGPIMAVVWIALAPGGDGGAIWSQLWSTTLPRYLRTTLFLMTGVGLGWWRATGFRGRAGSNGRC